MTRLALLVVVAAAACSKDAEEYVRRSKQTEAQLYLTKLTKLAKVYAIEHGGFPVGQAGPVPAADCCTQPGYRCAPDPTLWQAAPWKDLEFDVYDPAYFRYSYASDGKTFTATAIGDLDCDGSAVTYEAHGSLRADGTAETAVNSVPTGKD